MDIVFSNITDKMTVIFSSGKLFCEMVVKSLVSLDGLTFTFYLMRNGKGINTVWYSKNISVYFDLVGQSRF